MSRTRNSGPGLWFWVMLGVASISPLSASAQLETIDATARGTGTQMRNVISIKISISQFSNDEDAQALVNAFKKGQSSGLAEALEKMKTHGQIRLPSKTGYGLAYVTSTPTDTGRRIRFVTKRRIAFAEALQNTQSKDYDLTAGEININDKDPKQSSGTLFPAAQLIVNDQGQLQWELRQNHWELTNIIDWNAKDKE